MGGRVGVRRPSRGDPPRGPAARQRLRIGRRVHAPTRSAARSAHGVPVRCEPKRRHDGRAGDRLRDDEPGLERRVGRSRVPHAVRLDRRAVHPLADTPLSPQQRRMGDELPPFDPTEQRRGPVAGLAPHGRDAVSPARGRRGRVQRTTASRDCRVATLRRRHGTGSGPAVSSRRQRQPARPRLDRTQGRPGCQARSRPNPHARPHGSH